MFYNLFQEEHVLAYSISYIIVLILAFAGSFVLNALLKEKLPRDEGRAFAVNGEKSKGKPRGAGIIFILVFAICTLLLLPMSWERTIYMVMIVLAMLSGFFDDASEKPWGRVKKGLMDLAIAACTAITFVVCNDAEIRFMFFDGSFELPAVIYVLGAMFLIFVSINVVNCTDGVDGLCASLSIVSLLSFMSFADNIGNTEIAGSECLLFILALLPYLWFNASPSKILMGDAGSRAIGLYLAILTLQSRRPLFFLIACAVFFVDGGIGLVKILLIKLTKKQVLSKVRTPLHDHTRKLAGWSDTQTVIRFVIIQAAISILLIRLMMILKFIHVFL